MGEATDANTPAVSSQLVAARGTAQHTGEASHASTLRWIQLDDAIIMKPAPHPNKLVLSEHQYGRSMPMR